MNFHSETVYYVLPKLGDKLVQKHVLHETGQPDPTAKLNHAKTLFEKNGKAKQILIDKTLPPKIQRVFLFHERVQLGVIRRWVNSAPGRTMESVLHAAHFKGLEAGNRLAKRMGVFDEYKKIRGDS